MKIKNVCFQSILLRQFHIFHIFYIIEVSGFHGALQFLIKTHFVEPRKATGKYKSNKSKRLYFASSHPFLSPHDKCAFLEIVDFSD